MLISQVVSDDVMVAIAEQQTTKDAWDTLREIRVGEDCAKKARTHVLKQKLTSCTWRTHIP